MTHARAAESSAPPPRLVHPAGRSSEVLAPLVTALGSLVNDGVRTRPFQRDPIFIEQILPLAKALNLYFGTEYRGWEHVPRRGPCLIVGNHSGGAGSNDFWFLFHKWVTERGVETPLYSLAYNLLFGTPLLGAAMRRIGIIPASHANARKALAMGAGVSVFPGGDYEAFRPWRERNRIDFAGHTGFITLAMNAGVPVVPMTIHGAHQSTFTLNRGRGLAHLAGLDRLHVNVFPFVWNIPFGPAPAFVPSVQLPAKVIVHFGAPFDWARYGRKHARDPAVLGACYEEITASMQKALDRLARQDPHPVLTRLGEINLGDTRRRLEELFAARSQRRHKADARVDSLARV